MQAGPAFATLCDLFVQAVKPPMSRSQNTLSMIYVKRLLAGAARQGVSLADLFSANGLDPARLDDPEGRVEGRELIVLIQAVMRQTSDEFMGLATDARSKPGTFSMMAHAVINCPNLGKAIQRSANFYGLFQTPVQTRFEQVNNEGHLTLEIQDNSSYAETIHEAMMFISLRFWSWMVGRRLDPLVIEFAFDPPPLAHEFQALFNCPVNYGMDANVIRFPASWLSLPLAQTPLSLSRFLKDSVALIIGGRARPVGVADQIRSILSKEYGNQFPELADVCARLNLTPQTLRRRLKDEGTSYQVIKDQMREEAARFYLAKPMLSIDEISLMMGFSEASAFHRAFKKWTGMTPVACRRQLLGTTEP